MEKTLEDIGLNDALQVARAIISIASQDKGDPIAITILSRYGKPVVTLAMNGSMPLSADLSAKKAYTAWITQTQTMVWEKQGVDPSNLADPNITCFGGGIPMKEPVSGAVGVSGRKSYCKGDTPSNEDHELAMAASQVLGYLITGKLKGSDSDVEKAILMHLYDVSL